MGYLLDTAQKSHSKSFIRLQKQSGLLVFFQYEERIRRLHVVFVEEIAVAAEFQLESLVAVKLDALLRRLENDSVTEPQRLILWKTFDHELINQTVHHPAIILRRLKMPLGDETLSRGALIRGPAGRHETDRALRHVHEEARYAGE